MRPTPRRAPTPVKIVFAGENGRKPDLRKQLNKLKEVAHQSDAISKGRRKHKKDIDYRIQPSHQLLITFARSLERLRLGSKYFGDRLRTGAGVKLRGKGMVVKTFSGYPQVLV